MPKNSGLEMLVGTEAVRQSGIEEFNEGMNRIAKILDATSVLLGYYGRPEDMIGGEYKELPDLAAAMSNVLIEQAEIVRSLKSKAEEFMTPPVVTIPPAKADFRAGRKALQQRKGEGQ